VTGVHRLEHVERLCATYLTDEDAVGTHSEAVAQQLADRQLALALDVGRPVLEGDDVWVVDLQLAASSIVITRWLCGMKRAMTFRVVVLPEPVPRRPVRSCAREPPPSGTRPWRG